MNGDLVCYQDTLCCQGVKLESFPKCDFIPVDFYEVRHVKASFKKLMRACVPSTSAGQEASFLKAVEESGWLPQVILSPCSHSHQDLSVGFVEVTFWCTSHVKSWKTFIHF